MNSRLFLFLLGRITFQFEKDLEARVLNLCRKKGIPLDSIHVEEDRICISIPARYCSIFRDILLKTDTKAVNSKEYGLPFLLKKISVKSVFEIGLFLGITILVLQTQFIWQFRFEGNSRLTDSYLKEYLEEENVYIGMPTGFLDIEKLETKLRDSIDYIAWVSCRREGTTLVLSVKEQEISDAMENDIYQSSQYNIYSLCDGRIQNIVVRNGFALVKQGDYVSKGQLLVEGSVPIYNDDGSVRTYTSTCADADILIDYSEKMTFSVQKAAVKPELTGRVKERFLFCCQDKCIGYTGTAFHKSVVITDNLLPEHVLWFDVPFGLYENRIYEIYDTEERIDGEKAKDMMTLQLGRYLKTLRENGVKVIEKNVEIDDNEMEYMQSVELRLLGENTITAQDYQMTEN